MIDKKLEREIQEIQELIGLWNTFFQILEAATRSEEPLGWDEQKDTEFLKLKAQLAFRKQVLIDSLGKEEFSMAKDIKKVLTMCPSLDILSGESPIKINTIRSIWHEVFIALNKLIGNLKARKIRVASITPFVYHSKRIFESKGFKIGVIVVIVGSVIGAAALLIDFEALLERLKGLL